MKKLAFALVVVIVIVGTLSPIASAESRATTIVPSLGFNGTIAECEVRVFGNHSADYIEVTMKLMQGNVCYGSWSDTGYAYVYMYREANVLQNYVYTLLVEFKINGVVHDPVWIRDKCTPT